MRLSQPGLPEEYSENVRGRLWHKTCLVLFYNCVWQCLSLFISMERRGVQVRASVIMSNKASCVCLCPRNISKEINTKFRSTKLQHFYTFPLLFTFHFTPSSLQWRLSYCDNRKLATQVFFYVVTLFRDCTTHRHKNSYPFRFMSSKFNYCDNDVYTGYYIIQPNSFSQK
jgi:hypothetical protein